MSTGPSAAPQERLAELRSSAKGWHGIQLAALGFIGLCGVIHSSDSTLPRTLQIASGILVLVSFALACAGIYLVGRAAWPLYRGEPEAGGAGVVAATSRTLTRGLVLTFASIATLALATAASWWPASADGAGGDRVELRTNDGRSACGELVASGQPGALRIVDGGQPVEVQLSSLTSVTPVGRC